MQLQSIYIDTYYEHYPDDELNIVDNISGDKDEACDKIIVLVIIWYDPLQGVPQTNSCKDHHCSENIAILEQGDNTGVRQGEHMRYLLPDKCGSGTGGCRWCKPPRLPAWRCNHDRRPCRGGWYVGDHARSRWQPERWQWRKHICPEIVIRVQVCR